MSEKHHSGKSPLRHGGFTLEWYAKGLSKQSPTRADEAAWALFFPPPPLLSVRLAVLEDDACHETEPTAVIALYFPHRLSLVLLTYLTQTEMILQ